MDCVLVDRGSGCVRQCSVNATTKPSIPFILNKRVHAQTLTLTSHCCSARPVATARPGVLHPLEVRHRRAKLALPLAAAGFRFGFRLSLGLRLRLGRSVCEGLSEIKEIFVPAPNPHQNDMQNCKFEIVWRVKHWQLMATHGMSATCPRNEATFA